MDGITEDNEEKNKRTENTIPTDDNEELRENRKNQYTKAKKEYQAAIKREQ